MAYTRRSFSSSYFTRDRTYDTLVIIKLDRRDFIAFGNSSFLEEMHDLLEDEKKIRVSVKC